MVAKQSSKAKSFNDEAHYQGSKRVPLPQKEEYGTGLKAKKAMPKAKKKGK